MAFLAALALAALRSSPSPLARSAVSTFRGGASSMSTAHTPSIKLFYFDFNFWRAEVVRLALFIGDVPFEDVRDASKDEMKKDGKLTFGAFPALEVDGKMLTQTQAMASYAAKLAGLQPDSAWDAAKVDECINGCTDVTTTLFPAGKMTQEEKMAARAAMAGPDGRLTMYLRGLESICEQNGSNGYAVGNSLTIADLAIWRLAGWLESGIVDGLPENLLANYSSLNEVCAQVSNHPKVLAWIEANPKGYK